MEQPNETLPRDVVLSGADNLRTIFFWGGEAPPRKTSKIGRDLGQLSHLSANISGTEILTSGKRRY